MPDFHVAPSMGSDIALFGGAAARDVLGFDADRSSEAWRHATALLDGSAGDDGRRRVANILATTDYVATSGMHRLLAAHGIDPDAATAVALVAPGQRLMIMQGDAPDPMKGDRPLAHIHTTFPGANWVALGGDIVWTDVHVRLPRLPETAMMALVGRPVHEWVAHPLLESLGAPVVDFSDCSEMAHCVNVVTDMHVRKDEADD